MASRIFYSRIRRMIRLLLLCCYFDRFHGRRGGTLRYYDDKVDKSEFINHLLNERHFCEDIRETFKRWICCFTGRWILQGGRGINRLQKQQRLVYDLIEDAKIRYFLIEDMGGPTPKLRMDYRGRNFMKLLSFFNELAKEYKDFTRIISIILTSISGTLLVVFWQKIIEWLATLL